MTYNNQNGLWQLFFDHKEKAVASVTLDIGAFEFEKCRGEKYDLTVGEMRHGWARPKFQIGEIIYKPLL